MTFFFKFLHPSVIFRFSDNFILDIISNPVCLNHNPVKFFDNLMCFFFFFGRFTFFGQYFRCSFFPAFFFRYTIKDERPSSRNVGGSLGPPQPWPG